MVVAEDFDGNKYVIEEHAHRHKEIDDWVAIAKGVIKRHGDILFIVIQLDLNILNDLEERR